MIVRRVFAACALVILVAFHEEFVKLPATFFQWSALSRTVAARPSGNWPEYTLFLEGVREHTRPGDKIVIATLGMRNPETYVYAYYRANYLLAGREVLPLVPEYLATADYVAAWQTPGPPVRVVWEGHGGKLLTRR
jgi:hypothetical protein